MAFLLKSSAIQPGSSIAGKYTCDGADVSPPLRWEEPPAGTQSLALLCDDPDAPMGIWSHWVIYNIPQAVRELAENFPPAERRPDGTLQGRNDFGRVGYGGPCPPPGRPHRYFFRLYVLDLKPSLAPGLARKGLLKAIEGHVLAQAELWGTYGRG
jgi:Raf kinase inhibitor-like YbhB/YbcL family protein